MSDGTWRITRTENPICEVRGNRLPKNADSSGKIGRSTYRFFEDVYFLLHACELELQLHPEQLFGSEVVVRLL